MNILLTNDDGYNSVGIKLLKEILQPFGRIIIVAPSGPMSAKSVSITLGVGITIKQVEKDVYSVDATPADCVAYALSSLDVEFDLVISGCNNGWNISYDTMYSGTIGACLQALTFKIPALAFSCEFNFEIVKNHGFEVFKYILDNKMLSSEYALNVNFPLGDEIKGIKLANIYYRNDTTYYEEKDGKFFAVRNLTDNYEDDMNSDCYLVNNGFVSVTPLQKTLFSNEDYCRLFNNKN